MSGGDLGRKRQWPYMALGLPGQLPTILLCVCVAALELASLQCTSIWSFSLALFGCKLYSLSSANLLLASFPVARHALLFI